MRRMQVRRSRISPLPLLALAAFSLGSCADAESRDAPDTQPPEAETSETAAPEERSGSAVEPMPMQRTVPAQTTMTFVVDESISTETHEPGDRFTATLRSNVDDVEGVQVLDEGTPSQWVVAETSTEGDQSLLAVRLESILVEGEWTPLIATVTRADVQTESGDTGSETAAKIGVGTAAGALIGQILGRDTRSTLTGAGVGAAVGAVVALSTRGESVTLPAGSTVEVRLDEPLVVS